MAMIETWLRQNLKQPVVVHRLDGNLFSGDNQGNKIGVIVTDNNETVNFNDSCYGYFIRSDGATIPIEGTASGNTAYVVLPASCYVCIGQFSFVLKVGTTTLAACTGYIYRTSTETIVDPGTVVPSLSELLDQIGDCEAATAAAENVNISNVKAGHLITITTTDRDRQTVESTVYEPTVSVTDNNGDYDLTITSSDGSQVFSQTATIPNPIKLLPKATVTGNPAVFTDGADDVPLKNLTVNIEPKQNLHGYDKPWVGGAGKNMLPTTLELLKARHTSGTWNGNEYSYQGIVYTVLTDSDNNVIGISANGTATANGSMSIVAGTLPAGSYFVSGCPEGGSGTTYRINVLNPSSSSIGMDLGSGVTFTLTEEIAVRIYCDLRNGCVASNLVFRPMLCLATETDLTFEPYQNICPITGYDTVTVRNTGLNLFDGIYTDTKIISDNGAIAQNQYHKINTNYIPVKPNTNYTISGKDLHKRIGSNTAGGVKIGFYKSDFTKDLVTVSDTSDSLVITVTSSSQSAYALFQVANGAYDVQFEEGSVATSFHQNVFPIQISTADDGSGNLAGTVYDGTMTLSQSGEGTLVVDKMKKTYSSASGFTMNTSLSFNRFIAEVSDMASPVAGGHPGWSNQFPIATDYIPGANMADNTIYLAPLRYSSTKNYLIICAGQFATLEDFGTWLSNNSLDVVMPIATPATYTLTANQVKTLLGTNYISCDAGTVSLTYYEDVNLLINNIISQINDGTGVSF